MAQLYFLSVGALLFTGLLLAAQYLSTRFAALEPIADLAENRSVVITVGIVTLVVGFLKLFVRAPLDSVVFAGDLLPALVGIVTGALLILTRVQGGETVSRAKEVADNVLNYRTVIGVGTIVVGLLHFLFPAAAIL